MALENLKDIQKRTHGGARQGAGRPTHSKNPSTIEKEESLRHFQERVRKNVDKLFSAQLDLAVGEKYLMVVTTTGTGSKQRRETTVVTDPETIKMFLDEELENTDTEYYFMTTKPANNQALEGLLNRSFGSARQSIELEHSGEIKTGEYNPELATAYAKFLKEQTLDKE